MTSAVEGVIGFLPGQGGTHTLYAKVWRLPLGESFLDYEPLGQVENWLDKKARVPNSGPFKCKCGDMHMDGDPMIGTLLGDPKTEPAARFTELRIATHAELGTTKAQSKGLQGTYDQVVREFGL